METETLAMAQEIDFSMWGLFAQSTFVVKIVMLMLIAASFWAWSIIIQKLGPDHTIQIIYLRNLFL